MPIALSIVIPVYNEIDSIEATLNEIETYLVEASPAQDWELIVVNDGSNDGTLPLLNNLAGSKAALRVVDLGARMGRGVALRRGLATSEGDIIVSLDADLSYAPYHITRLVDAMVLNQGDLVLASAYGPGGTARNVPFLRIFLSRLGNMILAFMFGGGIHTLTCLVRAYRREFIQKLDLHSVDKDIHLEILSKTRILGGRILEVPGDLYWREEKLAKAEGIRNVPRRSTLSVRKTSNSHLFFALLNRPGLIFWFPGYLLFGIAAVCMILIFISIMQQTGGQSTLYLTLRDSMLHAAPTWITMLATFVLGAQFFTLGFLTSQNKRNYDETYKTLNAIYNRQMPKKM